MGSELRVTSNCNLIAGAVMLLSFAAAPVHAQVPQDLTCAAARMWRPTAIP
jgi:hypothetical protein